VARYRRPSVRQWERRSDGASIDRDRLSPAPIARRSSESSGSELTTSVPRADRFFRKNTPKTVTNLHYLMVYVTHRAFRKNRSDSAKIATQSQKTVDSEELMSRQGFPQNYSNATGAHILRRGSYGQEEFLWQTMSFRENPAKIRRPPKPQYPKACDHKGAGAGGGEQTGLIAGSETWVRTDGGRARSWQPGSDRRSDLRPRFAGEYAPSEPRPYGDVVSRVRPRRGSADASPAPTAPARDVVVQVGPAPDRPRHCPSEPRSYRTWSRASGRR
jgi:hypothetical protein